MPTVKLFGDCAIQMYPRDHAPPHFHVVFSDGSRCAVAIENLAVIAGRVPERRLRLALQWAAVNREALQAKWKEINQ